MYIKLHSYSLESETTIIIIIIIIKIIIIKKLDKTIFQKLAIQNDISNDAYLGKLLYKRLSASMTGVFSFERSITRLRNRRISIFSLRLLFHFFFFF